MKQLFYRKLGSRGFAHHLLLPILAIIAVAAIGTYLLGIDHAATIPYSTIALSSNSKECMDNSYNKKVTFNTVQLYTCNKTAAQQWTVNATATTAGEIVNSNGYCLNVYNTGKTVGTAVDIYPCKNSLAQQWTISSTGTITNPNSKLCVAYTAPLVSTGTPLKLATCSTTAATDRWTVSGGTGTTGTGGGGTGTGGTGTGGTTTGFITASGTQLMQNGKQYKSVSFNFSPVGSCWNSNWTTAQMDQFFAALPPNSIARFFAPPGGTDSASLVQSIVKEADKYNIHLLVSLAVADVYGQCDAGDSDSTSSGKTAAYYTDAVKSGSTYANWVKSIVTPLANDPGVAMWEIINEPWHNSNSPLSAVGGAAGATTYTNAAAALIRAAETAGAGSPKQLITLGPADIGETGGVSGMESIFKNIDVVDDHDYSGDLGGSTAYDSNELSELEQIGKALNKPYMIDEAGVEAGSNCSSSNVQNAWDSGAGLTLQNRVSFLLTHKATDYFNAGLSYVGFWLYTAPGQQASGCSYENIVPTDPIMPAVKGYKIP